MHMRDATNKQTTKRDDVDREALETEERRAAYNCRIARQSH